MFALAIFQTPATAPGPQTGWVRFRPQGENFRVYQVDGRPCYWSSILAVLVPVHAAQMGNVQPAI